MSSTDATIEAVTQWIARAAASRLPGIPVSADTMLIDNGMLDSLEILNLVSFLEERFAIALPVSEFIPENFRTARDIATLVTRLAGGAHG